MSMYQVSRRLQKQNGLWTPWLELDADTLDAQDTYFAVDDLPADTVVQVRTRARFADGHYSDFSPSATGKTLPTGMYTV